MLQPYLKIWDWELIIGRAVKAISSPGVRSPCFSTFDSFLAGLVCTEIDFMLHAAIYIFQLNESDLNCHLVNSLNISHERLSD